MQNTDFSDNRMTSASCFHSVKMQFALTAVVYNSICQLKKKPGSIVTISIYHLPKKIYNSLIEVFDGLVSADSDFSIREWLRLEARMFDYRIDFNSRNTKRLFSQIERLAKDSMEWSELYSFVKESAIADNACSIANAEQRLKDIIRDRYFGVNEDRLFCIEHFIKKYNCFIRTAAEISVCAERLSERFGLAFDIDEILIDGIINMVITYLTTNCQNRAVTEMYFVLSFLLNNTAVQITNDSESDTKTADIYINENGKFKNTVSINIKVQFINKLDESKKSLLKPLLLNLLQRRESNKVPKHLYRLIIDRVDFIGIFKPLMNGGYLSNAVQIRNRSVLLPCMALVSRVGGKTEMSYALSTLFDSISDKDTILITCCGGGARELDYIAPLNYKQIIYNEKVTALCALFKVVSDKNLTAMLKSKLEVICRDFDEIINDTFDKAIDVYRKSVNMDSLSDEEVVRLALCGFVVCNCSYNGIEGKRGFNIQHTTPNYGKIKRKFINKCKSLDMLNLKYGGMSILNDDIFDLLEKYRYNDHAIIYIDPPYPHGRNNEPCDYYINTVAIDRMVSVLNDRQTKAKVIISGTSVNLVLYSPLVQNGWSQNYIKTIHISAAYGKNIRYMDEYLWTNFQVDGKLLCTMSVC